MIELTALLLFSVRTPGEQIVIRRLVQNLFDKFSHRRICVTKGAAARIAGQSVESILRSGNFADVDAGQLSALGHGLIVGNAEGLANDATRIKRVDEDAGT